jgi:hypothetical protein
MLPPPVTRCPLTWINADNLQMADQAQDLIRPWAAAIEVEVIESGSAGRSA